MDKIYFDNGLRRQCLNVQTLSMEQFDRSVESFQNLLSGGEFCNVKRIIATGCGDSYLAAAEAKDAFARYLPDVEYEAPSAMEAGRYLELAENEPQTVVVGISVSGGTARVAEVLERGKKHGCVTVALTDVPDSPVAGAAKLLYHTNTPQGDNISGLRTYYVSMISLYVMAAALAQARTGREFLGELREQVSLYCEDFFANIAQIDEICFETALSWKQKQFFEVTADGPLFYCGRFISAKFAELSGDACAVIDSENYFHVNSLMYPGEAIGEMDLIVSDEKNADRMAAAADAQVKREGREVIVFCDKKPEEIGITEKVRYCLIAVPCREFRFLLPLFAYIPASILASYRATTIGEPFFRGGGGRVHSTIGTNPIRVI